MESPQAFTARIRRLECLTCHTPQDEITYHALMEEAKSHGLT
jgi:hypothetical protein